MSDYPTKLRAEYGGPDWYHAAHGLHDEAHHQHHDPMQLCVPVWGEQRVARALAAAERLAEIGRLSIEWLRTTDHPDQREADAYQRWLEAARARLTEPRVPVLIFVNRGRFEVEPRRWTVAELRHLPTPAIPDDHDFYQMVPGAHDEPVEDGIEVFAGLRLFSFPRHVRAHLAGAIEEQT